MAGFLPRLLTKVLRGSFRLLYHQLAWSYDLVAWLVSFGRWKSWTRIALKHVHLQEGGRVLELGFGPGHLQKEMVLRRILSFGIDESRQMCRIARRRLPRGDMRLVRGLGEHLPLAAATMDAIIATFPAEYIFDARVLEGCQRVLRKGGEVLFLMGVRPDGISILDLVLRFLYKLTNLEFQSRFGPDDYLSRMREAGFTVETLETVFNNDKIWIVHGHKV